MKKLLYGGFFLALVGIVMFGCQKSDGISSLKEMKNINVEDFFDEVSKMDLEISDENVIYIRYKFDKSNNTISIIEIKEAEPQFFILVFTKNQASSVAATNYIVECSNGDNSWTRSCDGKWPCGNLIAECLVEGGGATICEANMIYVPQISTFFIGESVSSSINF